MELSFFYFGHLIIQLTVKTYIDSEKIKKIPYICCFSVFIGL